MKEKKGYKTVKSSKRTNRIPDLIGCKHEMFCIVEDCSFPNPFFCGRVEGPPVSWIPTAYTALNASLLSYVQVRQRERQ